MQRAFLSRRVWRPVAQFLYILASFTESFRMEALMVNLPRYCRLGVMRALASCRMT